jgi:hypothetical protein
MSMHDTTNDGLPERSVFHGSAVPPRRRRSVSERLRRIGRNHVGMGVFLVMLVTSVTLVVFSR